MTFRFAPYIMRKMKNNHPHISSNMTLFIKLLSLYN